MPQWCVEEDYIPWTAETAGNTYEFRYTLLLRFAGWSPFWRIIMGDDIRIHAVGRPQRDLLIEMYERFEPLGAALGLPPLGEEGRREWIEVALSHKMNLAAFSPDRAVVGHCFLVADKAGSAEMAVFVHQEFRRRGIATALVEAVLEWGGVEGLLRVWTLTASENTAALRLQQRCGFRLMNSAFYGTEMEVYLPVARAAH